MYEEISLGNEKRYKTANDRVFVNEPMQIDSTVLAEELSSLQKHLDSESDESIRAELFRLIEKYK